MLWNKHMTVAYICNMKAPIPGVKWCVCVTTRQLVCRVLIKQTPVNQSAVLPLCHKTITASDKRKKTHIGTDLFLSPEYKKVQQNDWFTLTDTRDPLNSPSASFPAHVIRVCREGCLFSVEPPSIQHAKKCGCTWLSPTEWLHSVTLPGETRMARNRDKTRQ